MTLHSLQDVLVERIAARQKITFADFMALVLYWPRGGYYTTTSASASAGDYFTAPSAHPVFGAILALLLEEMWRLLDCPRPFVVVEPGAGSGQLARDITAYAEHLDASFRQALQYVAVDRSARLASSPGDGSFERLIAAGLPLKGVTGCILSNELLDALPVHRVTIRNGRLQEIYVAYKDGRFLEVEDEPSTPLLVARLAGEGVSLEEGQRAELCLELDSWVQDVAAVLERGFVLTVDYGYEAQDLYSRHRFPGTLRCYYRHTLASSPYVRVGEQDITAHVDFTAVASLGARYGLASQPLQTQAVFLNNLGMQSFQRRLATSGLGQRQRDANRMAMLDLARAGGMGDFKVLVQSKNIAASAIFGVQGASAEWKDRLERLPLPLLDDQHLALMEARYPHAAHSWGEGWPWR
ncbi:MAG: SAM-dependent methyltransferase [Dehalococcoidia bacterium]|nr:SAM-dependent methyltransferase [Dehalococcoidia bacterium]